MSNLPSLDDLIILFEQEPRWVHAESWLYGVEFALTRGEQNLIFRFADHDQTCAISLKQCGVEVFSAEHVFVRRLRIESAYPQEWLSWVSSNNKLTKLQTRPVLHVSISEDWVDIE